MKIAIVHDHLGFRGGGERTVLLLALYLKADFITAYAHPKTFSKYQKKLDKNLIILSKSVIKTRVMRFFWLRILFWKNRKIFKKYDIIIASAPTATEIVSKYSKSKATKIVYTHTTPRRVFDQYETSKKMYPPILRPLYIIFAKYWKSLYLKAIKKYDINIANSKCVRQRVKDHTGGDVNAVIWPPILTKNFKWLNQKDYFLSYSRIDEAKRVELVVKAFQKMPNKKLIVVSGGPRLDIVKKLAKGFSNIKIIGWVTDKDLFKYVGNARAVIYIPIDEDAGMTHLEANAAGKPVLAVREGGLIESTVDGVTGILINSNPGENDIIKAADTMTKKWCLEKKGDCIEHAQKYDQKIFFKKIQKIINDNSNKPIIGIDASRWEDPAFPGKHKRTGVEFYTKNLITNLIRLSKKYNVRIRLYTPRNIQSLPQDIQKVIPGNKKWTHKLLSQELKSSPPDIFITPSYYIPRNAPKNSYCIIHDIIFKTNPKLYSFKQRLSQNYALKKNIKRAKKIITVSTNTKNELIKKCNIRPERIKSVSMGYDPKNNLDKNQQRKNSIIYIGRIEKKKSIDVLIKAFYKFNKNNPNWELILAGKSGFGLDKIKNLINTSNLDKKIKMLGYVDEEKKWNLLANSSIFVHPGAHEGSCMPLLEAWDAKIPTIIADIPALHELGDSGSLYFRPSDENDLTEKITELSSNIGLQNKLINNGINNLKNISWENTAQKILDIILKS